MVYRNYLYSRRLLGLQIFRVTMSYENFTFRVSYLNSLYLVIERERDRERWLREKWLKRERERERSDSDLRLRGMGTPNDKSSMTATIENGDWWGRREMRVWEGRELREFRSIREKCWMRERENWLPHRHLFRISTQNDVILEQNDTVLIMCINTYPGL